MAQTQYRLGVLFVHGMGGQQSGGTLHQFGDPLFEWFDRWNAGGGKSSALNPTLSDVRLADSGGAPAHATITFSRRGRKKQRWLLAESHWADEFRPPSFSRLMVWLIALAPWITCEYMRGVWARVLTRNAGRTRRIKLARYAVRVPALLVVSVVGPVLCGVLVVFLLVLRVISLVPNDQLRKRVDSVMRTLVSSLGDVFTIVESPLDREAILGRIDRDVRWLKDDMRVERLVVVAHSAGAALTYRYLTTNPRVRPDLYVTVGQAIWRMRWVEGIRDRSVIRPLVGLGSLALVGGVAGLVGRAAGACWAQAHAGSSWLLLALAGLNLSGLLTAHVWAKAKDTLRTTIVKDGIEGTKEWNDYVASSDPVPAGRLAQPGRAPGGRFLVGLAAAATVVAGIVGLVLRSIGAKFGTDAPALLWPLVLVVGLVLMAHARTGDAPEEPEGFADAEKFTSELIRTQRTILTDHVTYPRNVEGFVTPLACSLAKLARLAVPLPALDDARQRRRERTAALALGRFAYLATALWLAVALAATDRFVHVGRWLRGAWEWLFTGKHNPIEGKGWLAHDRIGMVAVALGLAAGFAVLLKLWSAWDRAECERLLKGEQMSAPSRRWRTTFWLARAALPATVGLLSLPGARGCWLWSGWVAGAVGLVGGLPETVAWRRDGDLKDDPQAVTAS